MGHVAAHRFADAAAGRLSQRQLDRLNAHVATCDQCSAARQRVCAARGVFEDIRQTAAPDLHWEHIGARIYWVTSSEKRAAHHSLPRLTVMPWRRGWGWRLGVAGGTLVAAVGAVLLFLSMNDADTSYRAVAPPSVVEPAPSKIVVRTPRAGVSPTIVARVVTGVVTFAKGDVRLDNVALGFDSPLGAGHRLTTKRGSVAVQFDNASGFWVAPYSSVELRFFDSRRVELVVTGSVSVNITKRAPGQSFAVVAGKRRVEVRGTAFQVDFRGGRLNVSCVRGHVVVTDDKDTVDVRAGQTLQLWENDLLAGVSADTLRGAALALASTRAKFHMLPAWADANAMLATSSTLRVAAGPGRSVKVDGVERGTGKFALRVMSGRHHVAANGTKGQWVDLGAGKSGNARIIAQTSGLGLRAAQTLRVKQLSTSLRGNVRLRVCLRRLMKQGMDKGAFIVFDIGIKGSGTISHLNIARTNLPSQDASCMRTFVQRVAFPKGPAVTIRYRAEF